MSHTKHNRKDPAATATETAIAALIEESCSKGSAVKRAFRVPAHVVRDVTVTVSVTGKGSPLTATVTASRIGKTSQPVHSITRQNGDRTERVPGTAAFGVRSSGKIAFKMGDDDDTRSFNPGNIKQLAQRFTKALLKRCHHEEGVSKKRRDGKLSAAQRRELLTA